MSSNCTSPAVSSPWRQRKTRQLAKWKCTKSVGTCIRKKSPTNVKSGVRPTCRSSKCYAHLQKRKKLKCKLLGSKSDQNLMLRTPEAAAKVICKVQENSIATKSKHKGTGVPHTWKAKWNENWELNWNELQKSCKHRVIRPPAEAKPKVDPNARIKFKCTNETNNGTSVTHTCRSENVKVPKM